MKTVASLFFGLLIGWLASSFVLPIAYAERGYQAFGGEWLLIFICGWLGCMAMNKLLVNFEREDEEND